MLSAACLFLTPAFAQPAQPGPQAHFAPFEDPEAVALQLIDGATQSLDIAQYNIRNERFLVALRAARARGVAIRIVVDAKNARNPWNTLDDTIEAEGFAIKRFENTSHRYAIMHHKFTVIDGARVMTGSFNWNETAQLVNDENMIVLDDPGLVAGYQEEFGELWGSQTEQPGVAQGANGELLFSPEDRPRQRIVDAMKAAQRRILIAMFTFYDRDVARAVADAAQRGVEVVLLTEKKQADKTGEDERVARAGGRVIVGANVGAAHSAMHQKYAVIDDELVITGACNWSWTAFNHSNEDVLLLRDAALARRYTDNFAGLVLRYDATNYRPVDFGVARAEAMTHLLVRMPYTQPGDRVLLTGDHPALGSWSAAGGVELFTSDGIFPAWSGRVRLPAGAQVRCKAIVLRADGSVRWELGQDRLLDVDAAGTDGAIDVTFRERVPVTFRTRATLAAGEELRLVGADPALGGWDPSKAPAFTADPSDPRALTLVVELAGRNAYAGKLVLIDANGQPNWESGMDRSLVVGDQDAPQALDLPSRTPATPVSSTSPVSSNP